MFMAMEGDEERQERERSVERRTARALEGARTAGWGEGEGPGDRELSRLGRGKAAGWAAAMAALAAWGGGFWWTKAGAWAGWGLLAMAVWTSCLAGCAVGAGVGELARGGGALGALRLGLKGAWMFVSMTLVLLVCAPVFLIEDLFSRALHWEAPRWLGPWFFKLAGGGFRWARESMKSGVFKRPTEWGEAQMNWWEGQMEDQARRLGPLAAWGLASQRAGWGDPEGAVRAWELSPFDPGWRLEWRERGRREKKRVSLAQLSQEGPMGAPLLDAGLLEAAVEREALSEALAGGRALERGSRRSRSL